MKVLYDLFLLLYPLGAGVLSLKNEKAKKWLQGRKDIFSRLESIVAHDKKLAWVHCSSLGEFEQARPLIEKLREQFPSGRILLTFFSPSGYEVQKDYRGADYVFYLPIDSKQNAKRFLDAVRPSLIIFIKYEFWYYYITEARGRNIPILLASGIFRESQPFFRWYGNFYRRMLGAFSYLFVQDARSVELLRGIGIGNVIVTGDTRFDRVLEISRQATPLPAIARFCGSHPVVVAGSTWTEDDKELAHFVNSNPHIRFIVAPHDISRPRIDECLRLYNNAVAYSGLNESWPGNVLVIDNIGMLSQLYRYATIAYVGGGFGADGVHNVLEAAVYGRPVVFGPVYDKYIEAVELVKKGGGFPVANALELEKCFHLLSGDEFIYKQSCIAAADYVAGNAGATEKIIGCIQEKRLFTT